MSEFQMEEVLMRRASRGWVLVAVLLYPALACAEALEAALTLQKFIVTDPMNMPCPTPSGVTSISVNSGDQVTYCYVVTNSHGSTCGTWMAGSGDRKSVE